MFFSVGASANIGVCPLLFSDPGRLCCAQRTETAHDHRKNRTFYEAVFSFVTEFVQNSLCDTAFLRNFLPELFYVISLEKAKKRV